MSDGEISAAKALDRANRVYWKSLQALFGAAFTIIALILIYLLSDILPPTCEPPTWLERLRGESGCDTSPSIFLVTVIAGAIGAIFSNITRLYQIGEVSALFAQKIIDAGIWRMSLYALVPAVIGAVAAAVIYLIFAGKFIQGTPFPVFGCDAEVACDSITALIDHWGPDQAEDYAKMIFWGFVGGFSERLVPDMLGQYSKLMEQKGTASQQATPSNADSLAKTKVTADTDKAAAEKSRSNAADPRTKPDPPTASP